MTIRIHEKKFYLFDILRPLFRNLLELHVTYFSILADFQDSGDNVHKLCLP